MNKAQYFVGRPCTVFTTPINRNFKEENPRAYPGQLLAYFTGFVESVDATGVMLNQFNDTKKTFVFFNNIVAISEESLEVEPEKIEEVVVKKAPALSDIDELSILSGQMKQQFGK
jgi:hypothetical protein